MPLVKTEVSYAHEEFGRNEVSTYQCEVEDLDLESWLWYLLKITELAGFDVKDIHAVTGNGKFFSTEE